MTKNLKSFDLSRLPDDPAQAVQLANKCLNGLVLKNIRGIDKSLMAELTKRNLDPESNFARIHKTSLARKFLGVLGFTPTTPQADVLKVKERQKWLKPLQTEYRQRLTDNAIMRAKEYPALAPIIRFNAQHVKRPITSENAEQLLKTKSRSFVDALTTSSKKEAKDIISKIASKHPDWLDQLKQYERGKGHHAILAAITTRLNSRVGLLGRVFQELTARCKALSSDSVGMSSATKLKMFRYGIVQAMAEKAVFEKVTKDWTTDDKNAARQAIKIRNKRNMQLKL
jgi:hypothetical protein